MFTQPCFIRKNTQELRRKIEELGYKNLDVWAIPDSLLIVDTDGTLSDCAPDNDFAINMFLANGYIDCGNNEALFLALAALRDDSDYMQQFTNRQIFIKCIYPSFSEFACYLSIKGPIHIWRKATVSEIIEHFK